MLGGEADGGDKAEPPPPPGANANLCPSLHGQTPATSQGQPGVVILNMGSKRLRTMTISWEYGVTIQALTFEGAQGLVPSIKQPVAILNFEPDSTSRSHFFVEISPGLVKGSRPVEKCERQESSLEPLNGNPAQRQPTP